MQNLDAYFEKLDYQGERAPTLAVLRTLHSLHTQRFAFENLSPLLGLDVRLDIASLFDKFIRQQRGGYCFEQNLLFQYVLNALGFKSRGLAARVCYNLPAGMEALRTHMLLLLDIDGASYIADTGFGGLTLTEPIRFVTDIEQSTSHGLFRLLDHPEGYMLSAKVGNQWKALYSFGLGLQLQSDFEVMNWYVATHPRSRFVNNLIAARPSADGRHALLNNHYSFYGLDGPKKTQRIKTVAELEQLLLTAFGVRVPQVADAKMRLQKLLGPAIP